MCVHPTRQYPPSTTTQLILSALSSPRRRWVMPRGMRHGQETKFSFPFPQRLGPGELSMARRSWLAEAVGTLFWLAGDFPPPALFPNFSSAQEGDLILARCVVFSHVPITHIFFCKNGVELAKHPVGKGQFTSTLTIWLSVESSGTYSCGYQRRSSLGQILLSRLSVPWVLTTKGEKDDQVKRNSTVATSPELPAEGLGVSISLAMAVLLLLALALSLHLLLQIGKRTTSPVGWCPLNVPPIGDSRVHALKLSKIRRDEAGFGPSEGALEAPTRAWSWVCSVEAPLCRDGPTRPIDLSPCLAGRKASPAGQVEELHAPVEDHSISQPP
ncbi:uncharacterized protein LOC134507755 isoform X4 [Chroicocephalus ridibundus]|uniref:uncharacterized protein LOC134507755 isoform X4 n=1 Tax=Chroicocephalus ridibundus TaxID=1192867 RepID=UPI002FDDC457